MFLHIVSLSNCTMVKLQGTVFLLHTFLWLWFHLWKDFFCWPFVIKPCLGARTAHQTWKLYNKQLENFTYIFKIIISFLAAFLTFLPSFLWNFLQVYIFKVFLSFARNISQNSSLLKKKKHASCFEYKSKSVLSHQHYNMKYSRFDNLSEVILVGHLWGIVVILLLPECQTTKWHGSSCPIAPECPATTQPVNNMQHV